MVISLLEFKTDEDGLKSQKTADSLILLRLGSAALFTKNTPLSMCPILLKSSRLVGIIFPIS